MYNYHYICRKDNTQYSYAFENIGCIPGDVNELLKQVKNNPNFCRDQKALNYDYFVSSITNHTVIYMTDDTDNIVGCCSIGIIGINKTFIIIYGISVPETCVKKRGTLLIQKIKELGYSLKCSSITLATSEYVQVFYEKNGFAVINDTNKNIDDDFISMIYYL